MSNTARKIEHFEVSHHSADIMELHTMSHNRIAQIAEEAANLPGNKPTCDFEEFLAHYGMGGVTSDFA